MVLSGPIFTFLHSKFLNFRYIIWENAAATLGHRSNKAAKGLVLM